MTSIYKNFLIEIRIGGRVERIGGLGGQTKEKIIKKVREKEKIRLRSGREKGEEKEGGGREDRRKGDERGVE